MCYFAGRAAPMGAVSGGVVTATYYNFSPGLVARSIPRAWELARPDAIIGARFAAADAALTRLLGPDVIASPDMITLAGRPVRPPTPASRKPACVRRSRRPGLAGRPAPGDVACAVPAP